MDNNKRNGSVAQARRVDRKFYKFYLVEPPENADADHLAEKLIGMRNVEEVFVTDGDYGFVVKTRFSNGKEPDDVSNYLSRTLGSSFGKVTSYYQYKK